VTVLCAANCIPLLIQQNVYGSDFFNRSWAEFKVGFNDSGGNYWLGNDLLSQLTHNGRYKLRFDLQAQNGTRYYAEYSSFAVLSEAYNYKLLVSGYSGNAGDALRYHNNMMFTTYDRDNDPWNNDASKNNCAVHNGGGFWYKGCSMVQHQCRSPSWRKLQMVVATDWTFLAAVVTHVADVLDHFAGSADNFDLQQ